MAFPKKMQPVVLVFLLGIVFCSRLLMAQGDCDLCDQPFLQATDGEWYCPDCSPEKFGAASMGASMGASRGLSGTAHADLLMNILEGSVPVESMPVSVGQGMQSLPLPAKQAGQMQHGELSALIQRCVLGALNDAGISSVALTDLYQLVASECSSMQKTLAGTSLSEPESFLISAMGLSFMFSVSISTQTLIEAQTQLLSEEMKGIDSRVDVIITDENGHPAMVGALLPSLSQSEQDGVYLVFGELVFISHDQMANAFQAVLQGLAKANRPRAGAIYFFRRMGFFN